MRGRGRLICLLLCLLAGLGSGSAFAQGQSSERPIVLAQQERPSLFRHLFKRRAREIPPPRSERRYIQRQQQLRRVAPPEPQLIRPERKKREAARPSKRRQASRSAKQDSSNKAAKQREERAKPRKERRTRAVAATPKPVQAVEKAPDARKILVIGDFMAGQLAKGLTQAYAENAGAVVVDANRGDSGLIRADYYDWAKEIPALVVEHGPAAIVVMVGANDRQSVQTDAGAQQVGSDGWRGAYAARVSALVGALKATGKPVLWTGLAPVRPGQMSRDYSAMNGVFREESERAGLRYIDTWNGFADETGKFVAKGPDVGGQQVQLRAKDGVNFTKAGQRKLAFFVEGDLNPILGGSGAGGAVPQIAGLEALAGPPPELVREGAPIPTIGPMVPIEALTTGGDALSGEAAVATGSGAASDAVLQRLARDGSSAPLGRADNFAQAPIVPAAAPVQPAPPPGSAPTVQAAPPAVPPPAPAL